MEVEVEVGPGVCTSSRRCALTSGLGCDCDRDCDCVGLVDFWVAEPSPRRSRSSTRLSRRAVGSVTLRAHARPFPSA